jgi:hypothetical protein
MRTTAPKLILQGNTILAKKWIPWAIKALDRIKNLTVTGIANKVFRPVTGVAVHVRSVNNIDWIRIAVVQLKGCKNDFEEVPIAFPASFQIGFTYQHWVDKKEIDPPGTGVWGYWLFGDGTTELIGSVGSQRNHIYPNAGEFDTTLYSSEQDLDDADRHYNLASFSLSTTEAVFTIDTNGTKKALGDLSFSLEVLPLFTVDDITVTIDGEPVEITVSPSNPTRSVQIVRATATGEVMTAVVTSSTPWGVPWLLDPDWDFIKYKCLATKTKTITVT